MPTVMQHKRSETANNIPLASDLAVGEIGINSTDQKIYTKNTNGDIVIISEIISGKENLLELVSTDSGSAANPILELYRNSFSPFDQDSIGEINFYGKNDVDTKIVYGKITSLLLDASENTEDSNLEFHVQNNGSDSTPLKIKGDGIHLSSGTKITFADGTTQNTASSSGGGSVDDSILMSILLG